MIADTGFLVALLAKDDRHHLWAKRIVDLFDPPLITCEEVMTEASYLIGGCVDLLAMVADGKLVIDFALSEHVNELVRLGVRYNDRRPDLADLCVVRMSEIHPRLSVITVDRDFLVYRRNRNEPIPVIMPPPNL